MSNLEIVYATIRQIPPGKVATYGQIASLAGMPGSARYVGTVLSKLPTNTQLPWHRVINAKGEISFPVGSDAFREQVKRLAKEEIILNKNHKIKLKEHQWCP